MSLLNNPSSLLLLRRPHLPLPTLPTTQHRTATLLRRPKRPYTFTQLVTLSDGSTYTHRTTSPEPVYRSIKDTRNTPLWNPSNEKVLNFEADEAGKLRAFRDRFGRGWDAGAGAGKDEDEDGDEGEGDEGDEVEGGREKRGGDKGEDNLVDLISGFGRDAEAGVREGKERSGKRKGGER